MWVHIIRPLVCKSYQTSWGRVSRRLQGAKDRLAPLSSVCIQFIHRVLSWTNKLLYQKYVMDLTQPLSSQLCITLFGSDYLSWISSDYFTYNREEYIFIVERYLDLAMVYTSESDAICLAATRHLRQLL